MNDDIRIGRVIQIVFKANDLKVSEDNPDEYIKALIKFDREIEKKYHGYNEVDD
jgi:hypothetical protein